MEGTVVDDQAEAEPTNFMELAADLVAAYVSNNRVSVTELPGVIASVYAAVSGLANPVPTEPPGPEKPTPAQVKKSITPDALISFVDGKSYKTLKRHLAKNGLTMDGYRSLYGLPVDYPSTSATYSAQRSELARSLGLGQQRRKAIQKAASLDEMFAKASTAQGGKAKATDAAEEAPKARGRKKAAETA